ncbi:MAG: hypothetical protein AB1750_07330 [Chloroflexota bacterium]
MNNDTYHKLDRAALWLLVGEFGLAALLLLLTLLMVIGNMISYNAFDFGYSAGEAISLGIVFIYALGYLANLTIGVMGLILYARDNREGYPGTGHLANWTFLSATLWIGLLLVAIFLTNGF